MPVAQWAPDDELTSDKLNEMVDAINSLTAGEFETGITLDLISTPSAPGTGLSILYPKTGDGRWYYRSGAAGNETLLAHFTETPNALMTTTGDILVASGPNAPARVAIGTARQNLQVNSGATGLQYASSLQSLMTAQGDIVQASSANTPARLAIGTARQNLAVNSGATAVEYVASLQSLMTATGDIVIASGANTPARLATGASTTVLTGGTTPAYAQVSNTHVAAAAAIAQTKLGAFDRCVAYKSSAVQSIANTTETAITLDAEVSGDSGMHDNVTNNSRLTFLTDGLHYIFGVISYASDADGLRDVYLRIGGSTRIATGRAVNDSLGNGPYIVVQQLYQATASQYVEMTTWHSAGNALDVNNGQANTFLAAVRVTS